MKKIGILLLLIGLIFILNSFSFACVGKTIYIGQEDNPESEFLAELLATIIRERTGTTAIIKSLGKNENAHNLLENGTIDILVEYTGFSLVEILEKREIPSQEDKIFDIVRNDYQEKLNLVWLKPFGFNSELHQSKRVKELGLSCYPAPVIRKDTLKKFPALPRLLNKLGGIIDDKTYSEILKKLKSQTGLAGKLAREFLKEKSLI